MKKSYSIEPNLNVQYDQMAITNLSMMNLSNLKALADKNAVQFDICVKTDGVRINIVKKNPDKTVRKRSVECDNNELQYLMQKFHSALSEILTTSMMGNSFPMM